MTFLSRLRLKKE